MVNGMVWYFFLHIFLIPVYLYITMQCGTEIDRNVKINISTTNSIILKGQTCTLYIQRKHKIKQR